MLVEKFLRMRMKNISKVLNGIANDILNDNHEVKEKEVEIKVNKNKNNSLVTKSHNGIISDNTVSKV